MQRARAARKEKERLWAIHLEELKTRDTRNIYWGPDGNLWTGKAFQLIFEDIVIKLLYIGRSIINRDEDLLDIIENDTFDDSDPTSLWYSLPIDIN